MPNYNKDDVFPHNRINARNYNKTKVTERNITLIARPECFSHKFLISNDNEIDAALEVLKHEEYVDVDATLLR